MISVNVLNISNVIGLYVTISYYNIVTQVNVRSEDKLAIRKDTQAIDYLTDKINQHTTKAHARRCTSK